MQMHAHGVARVGRVRVRSGQCGARGGRRGPAARRRRPQRPAERILYCIADSRTADSRVTCVSVGTHCKNHNHIFLPVRRYPYI